MFSFVRDGVVMVRANKSDATLGVGTSGTIIMENILVVIVLWIV